MVGSGCERLSMEEEEGFAFRSLYLMVVSGCERLLMEEEEGFALKEEKGKKMLIDDCKRLREKRGSEAPKKKLNIINLIS